MGALQSQIKQNAYFLELLNRKIHHKRKEIYESLDKYEKQAKAIDPTFPHLHAHLLRHTRSQHWYDAGINLEEIALLLGYSQLTTTLTYTFLNVNRKRAAIEKALGGDEPLFISEKPIFLDENIIKKLYGL